MRCYVPSTQPTLSCPHNSKTFSIYVQQSIWMDYGLEGTGLYLITSNRFSSPSCSTKDLNKKGQQDNTTLSQYHSGQHHTGIRYGITVTYFGSVILVCVRSDLICDRIIPSDVRKLLINYSLLLLLQSCYCDMFVIQIIEIFNIQNL